MARTSSQTARPVGRPPAGAREGEKVKDYPQLSIRLPADVRAKLQAMSHVSRRAQWRLIRDSIECYFRTLPDRDQDAISTRADALLAGHKPGGRKGHNV